MQPLTSGLWGPAPWLNRFQVAASDIISFHQYANAQKLTRRIAELQRAHSRPVLCTEWMSRPLDSRFETHLPIFKEHQVGCYGWGLVAGKTQTYFAWENPPGEAATEPELWHHDILRADGSAFDRAETDEIRRITRTSRQARP